jgi:hypothetical protein
MNYGSDRPDKDNGQWDRWNSNASNSSYYNQPVHKPQGQAFSTAALVCGIVSVTTCCAVVISLPLGALGLIFAHLARRQGKPVNSTCLLGQVCSWVGLVCAGALLIYSLAMLPSLMKNEAFQGRFDRMTEQVYGMDFREFMETVYGFSIEE